MTSTDLPDTPPTPEPGYPAQELHKQAVGTLQGEYARLTNGAAGAVIAGNRLAVAGGGSGVMIAGHTITITGGGAGIYLAGKTIQVRQGGGGLLLTGQAQVERGIIGIMLAGRAELKDSRVLLNTPAALALGAALGLVLAVANRLLRRG